MFDNIKPMGRPFRWIDWNLEHPTEHGCTIEEIESVVSNPGRGYPRQMGNAKLAVEGRGHGGRFIRVIYIIDDGEIFVIHSMPLTTRRRRGGR